MSEVKFYWSDAWLLTSLFFLGKEEVKDYSEIIACGDWINHAIFNYDEFEVGVSNLVKAGFISFEDGVIRLSEKAIELKQHMFSNKKRLGVQRVFESVEKHMKVTYKDKVNKADLSDLGSYISEAEFNCAVDNYLNKYGTKKVKS